MSQGDVPPLRARRSSSSASPSGHAPVPCVLCARKRCGQTRPLQYVCFTHGSLVLSMCFLGGVAYDLPRLHVRGANLRKGASAITLAWSTDHLAPRFNAPPSLFIVHSLICGSPPSVRRAGLPSPGVSTPQSLVWFGWLAEGGGGGYRSGICWSTPPNCSSRPGGFGGWGCKWGGVCFVGPSLPFRSAAACSLLPSC